MNKTQEHLVTTQAHRRAPGKPGATTLTTENLAFSILQSNNRTRIAETQSKVDSAVREPPEKGVFPAGLE